MTAAWKRGRKLRERQTDYRYSLAYESQKVLGEACRRSELVLPSCDFLFQSQRRFLDEMPGKHGAK